MLDTKVYCKPQNTLALIHRKSAHLQHTFSGVVKAQCVRFARICSNRQNYREISNKLIQSLQKRGFHGRHSIIPLVRQIESSYFDNMPQTWMACGSIKCSLCKYWSDIPQVILQSQSQKLNTKADCNSINSVYIIWCRTCPDAFYVGQTTGLRQRLLNHISDIRRNKKTSISNHFNQHIFNSLSDVMACNVLENLDDRIYLRQDKILSQLNRLENKWIHRLGSNTTGLNKEPHGTNMITIKGPHSRATSVLARKFTTLAYSLLGQPDPGVNPKSRHRFCPKIIYAPSIRRKISNFLVRSKLT